MLVSAACSLRTSVCAFALCLSFVPAAAIAQASPSAFTSAKRYDAAGRVVGTISADPGTGTVSYGATRNTYDAAGHLIRVEVGVLAAWQPEVGQIGGVAPAAWSGFTINSQIDMTYDGLDRKLLEITSSGGTAYEATQYSYDAVGRLECTAERLNPAVYGSLPASACVLGTAGSNGSDRITRNVYDAAGHLLKIQKSFGVTTANGFPVDLQQDYSTFTYTLNGKQATVIDANGNQNKYTYDGFDRQVQWNFPDATSGAAASTTDYEAYTYDPNSNHTSLRKRDGRVINYSYDALNRLTSKTFAGGACVVGYACSAPPSGSVRDVYYDYDLRGLQTGAHFDSAAGVDAVLNAYDGFGRLSASAVSMGGVSRTVTHLYDANGNRIRITHPDGYYFTYDYDGLDRPIAINEMGVTQAVSFGYDNQGRKITEGRGAVITTYGYDAVSRLTSLGDNLAGTTYDVSTTLSYNAANQITDETRDNPLYAFNAYTTASSAYAANGLNQYSTVGAGSLSYDANGNLMSNGGTTFTYDVENRLVAASGTLSATYTYDPLGRMYFTGAQQFLYDGDALIGEYASGVMGKRYVHGNGEDNPLLMYTGGIDLSTRFSLQSDHLGSVVTIADASGNNGAPGGAINTYDEYGVPGVNNFGIFQYTGQIYLSALGMYHYKSRIYSSRLGRFLQTDPVGYKDQANLYSYVGNDPVNRTDPTGEEDGDIVVTGQRLKPPPPPPPPSATPISVFIKSLLLPNPTIAAPQLTPQGAQIHAAKKMTPEEIEKAYEEDAKICRIVKTAACWASAMDRRADRVAGRTPRKLQTGRMKFTISDETKRKAGAAAGGVAIGTIIYWIISEGSRVIPIRNAVPVP